MRQKFLEAMEELMCLGFRLHDLASDFIARNFLEIKRGLLAVAYLSLFGILLPEMRRGFGSLAEVMLLFILFLSPLSKILRMKLLAQLMGLRREFGILMGCLALTHGAAYFTDPASFFLNIAPYLNASFFSMRPLFYLGIFALILTLLLLMTSNNFSVRLLGGEKWKRLHRIIYLLLLFVLLHILFVQSMRKGYNIVDLIRPVGIIFSYGLLKLLAWRNFLPSLRGVIAYVSARYQTYTLAEKERNLSSISL